MNDKVLPHANPEAILAPSDGTLGYMTGFGNHFSTEAVRGALPIGRNSPQQAPLGLYAEQLSGSAFTAHRPANRRTWFYRILPSVKHTTGFRAADAGLLRTAPCRDENTQPFSPMRWNPVPLPDEPTTFLEGIRTISTAGDAQMGAGMAAHVYVANRDMQDQYFYNADGEMLIVPQLNRLTIATECGVLELAPGEIAVIPRAMKFQVHLPDGTARGYICENYGAMLDLPGRGPIGANCLANERDFLTPVAAYQDTETPCQLYSKALGKLYVADLAASPLDVVAWHGNLAPYKYDLSRFSTIGSISYDHPDPSIFTVLSSPSDSPGTANIDFVIFPDRWLVMEDTFRPPWYHSNIMSEFMGLIHGVYDAKPGGFSPGAMSLHNMMIPHGPDRQAFESASTKDLAPEKLSGTMAFMFETRYPLNPTAFGSQPQGLDLAYPDCWQDLPRQFKR